MAETLDCTMDANYPLEYKKGVYYVKTLSLSLQIEN